MAKIKINRNTVIAIIGILFMMSLIPGEGTKASNQQAIVATEHSCETADDCPVCVGSGLAEANETDFLGELSYAKCEDNVCHLSDLCIVWDCPTESEECNSIKRTLLDNTIVKFNENPKLLFWAIAIIIAILML